MTMIDGQSESLMALAQSLTGSNRRVGGKSLYWRRPLVQSDGEADPQPGWIFWASNNPFALMDNMALGWIPLNKFGEVKGSADGVRSPWFVILSHKDGPAAFLVDQLIAYQWYDPDKCFKDTGVRAVFPQLGGVEITEYDCPECNTVKYAKPIWLARHLRNAHNYDRSEVQAYGKEVGIDFGKELVKGKTMKRFIVGETVAEPEPEEEVVAAPVIRKNVPDVVPELSEKQKAARAAFGQRARERAAARSAA